MDLHHNLLFDLKILNTYVLHFLHIYNIIGLNSHLVLILVKFFFTLVLLLKFFSIWSYLSLISFN